MRSNYLGYEYFIFQQSKLTVTPGVLLNVDRYTDHFFFDAQIRLVNYEQKESTF